MIKISENYESNSGFLYILSNPSMPNIYKIGYTERSVKERVMELSSNTGVPTPFAIEFSFLTENPKDLESDLHDEFEGYRVNGSREFFKVPLESILSRINEARKYNILAEVESLNDLDKFELSRELQQIFPKGNFFEKINNSSDSELLGLLHQLPKDHVVKILHRLFQDRPEIWRELK